MPGGGAVSLTTEANTFRITTKMRCSVVRGVSDISITLFITLGKFFEFK